MQEVRQVNGPRPLDHAPDAPPLLPEPDTPRLRADLEALQAILDGVAQAVRQINARGVISGTTVESAGFADAVIQLDGE